MKSCAECGSLFPGTQNFCELDGTPLLDESADSNQQDSVVRPTTRPSLSLVAAVVGVLIGVLLVLFYFTLTRQTSRDSSNHSGSSSIVAQQQLPSLPFQSAPVATPTPSVEPSASPSIEPSPSPQPSAQPIQLSSNPISTTTDGRDKTGPVIISQRNGISIQADEAWQTAEGIWYRRGGVVSLLDPKDVKAIEKVPVATPQTAASTPTP
jgi:cytoskeletal protein RodZ